MSMHSIQQVSWCTGNWLTPVMMGLYKRRNGKWGNGKCGMKKRGNEEAVLEIKRLSWPMWHVQCNMYNVMQKDRRVDYQQTAITSPGHTQLFNAVKSWVPVAWQHYHICCASAASLPYKRVQFSKRMDLLVSYLYCNCIISMVLCYTKVESNVTLAQAMPCVDCSSLPWWHCVDGPSGIILYSRHSDWWKHKKPGADPGFCEGGFVVFAPENFCLTIPTFSKPRPFYVPGVLSIVMHDQRSWGRSLSCTYDWRLLKKTYWWGSNNGISKCKSTL